MMDMTGISFLVDEYALGVFRKLSDESLVEKHKFFTNLAQTQTDNGDPAASGAKAMANLVLQVIRERQNA